MINPFDPTPFEEQVVTQAAAVEASMVVVMAMVNRLARRDVADGKVDPAWLGSELDAVIANLLLNSALLNNQEVLRRMPIVKAILMDRLEPPKNGVQDGQ